jgi:hypothetical protein
MSVASILDTTGLIREQYLPPTAGGASETTLYSVGILANRTNDTFTPTKTGIYIIKYTMTYDQAFGVPGAGAFSEILFNAGGTIMSVAGNEVVLPTTPGADRNLVITSTISLTSGTTYGFDTVNSGYTTPGACGMELDIIGPI